jgi:hypothetical protein
MSSYQRMYSTTTRCLSTVSDGGLYHRPLAIFVLDTFSGVRLFVSLLFIQFTSSRIYVTPSKRPFGLNSQFLRASHGTIVQLGLGLRQAQSTGLSLCGPLPQKQKTTREQSKKIELTRPTCLPQTMGQHPNRTKNVVRTRPEMYYLNFHSQTRPKEQVAWHENLYRFTVSVRCTEHYTFLKWFYFESLTISAKIHFTITIATHPRCKGVGRAGRFLVKGVS